MRALPSILALAVVGLLSAACSDSSGPGDGGGGGGGGGGGTPIVSQLTCEDPETGDYIQCSLILASASSFEITLLASSCVARGTTLRITEPLTNTLTPDGCYIQTGQTWRYPVTWPAGTEIRMEVQSAPLELPTALRVSGAYPEWTLNFEDGGDTDVDDLVLRVRAIE
jgi:hypothetical protein